MSGKVVLALDLGTTGNRVVAFAQDGTIVAKAYHEFKQYYPKPGWVEHDAEEILKTTVQALKTVVAQVGLINVVSLGITNQRETTVIWDKQTGRPIYPAIVWQCRRTESSCNSLESHHDRIKQKTGLFIDPYFSGTKIQWLLDQVDGARKQSEKGELLFGTIDTWIIWNLTARKIHATDVSNASRTMIYNIHKLTFDQELLDLMNIPTNLLPEVKASNDFFGVTDKALLGKEIPINAVLGDQQASLFAHSGWEKGVVKNTYGTGLFVVTNTQETMVFSEELITTIAWKIDGQVNYALEGSVFMGGATMQWCRDNLGLVQHAGQSEIMAKQLHDNEGVYLVPAFQGLGAPYWQSSAQGVLVGLTRKTEKAAVVRAGLEAMAYQSRDVIESMNALVDFELNELHVDGGACANDFLMQFQADMLDLVVKRPKVIETTALGIAGLSGITSGFWKKGTFKEQVMAIEKEFQPTLSETLREKYYLKWKKAVQFAIDWGKD